MIVRVLDAGRYMPGLVRYLVGEGKANEHTDPHVVAGSGALAEEFAGTDWDAAKAGELASVLDGAWREARRSAGLPVLPEPGERSGGGALDPAHVFHVSLSLGADQGQLPDEKWAQIAQEYVDAMDFSAAGGKAECQWVAVRHGLSTGRNDHIHVAVCLVREDGTRASDFRSFRRSRTAADAIERKHGLRPVKDYTEQRGLPGYSAGESAKAQRLGRAEPDRHAVARQVRAAAASSSSEAQFVRTARARGLLVRPRFAAGRTDIVEGYSAALRPVAGQLPVWFGGGRLARDLTLPALRQRWLDTPQGAEEAVAQWRRPVAARRPSGPGRPRGGGSSGRVGADRQVRVNAARAVAEVNAELARVDPADRAAWGRAAQQAAGVFAQWSLRVEGVRPGPLARAADALARSAQPARGQVPVPQLVSAEAAAMGGRQLALMVRASGSRSDAGWLAVMRQLDRTTQAIHDAHAARGEAIRARQIASEAGQGLQDVRDRLTAAVAASGTASADRTADQTADGTADRAADGTGRDETSGGAVERGSVRDQARLHDPYRPGTRGPGERPAQRRPDRGTETAGQDEGRGD